MTRTAAAPIFSQEVGAPRLVKALVTVALNILLNTRRTQIKGYIFFTNLIINYNKRVLFNGIIKFTSAALLTLCTCLHAVLRVQLCKIELVVHD